MEPEYGLSRSSNNMRFGADPTTSVVHALKPQERVRILDEEGGLLQVESTRWQPPVRGYVPRAAIVCSTRRPAVFPQIDMGGGVTLPSVPISLPLRSFLRWLESSEETPWLPAGLTSLIKTGKIPSIGKLIRNAIDRNRSAWEAWVGQAEADGRLDTCTLDEWLTRMQGGREMWSIRAERLFTDPSGHSATVGWVAPEDVLHWTGRVRVNNNEPKYTTWYEIEIAKADRQLSGWYKASLLDEFFMPTPDTDLSVPQNRAKAFDLAKSRLRLPADEEVLDSRRAGRAAAQYIDVRRALGSGLLHHNLCGEFCVAALASADVIPLLQKWLDYYPRAREILAHDQGTSIPDLQSALDAWGMKHEFFRAVGSTSPITPNYIRRKLDSGMMAIVGTGVTPYGAIKSYSGIRHWVVVEDILRVGSSGWLRVYNPYSNREESCRFDEVFDVGSRDAIGLWVEPSSDLMSQSAAVQFASVPEPVTLEA